MKRKIAEKLLDIKAVALNPNDPFTWSSGLRAPIYCDNRLTLSYPEVRKEIAAGLQAIILDKFPEAELIAGTATAGIPHAAWVSDIMELPMCYVRSKAKGHGKGKQIEGQADKGQKVVVVEDLISTGGSAITAVKALREAGCEVLGVAAIFTYQLEKGKQMLAEEKIEAYTLTDIEAMTEAAVEKGFIQEEDMKKLVEWRKDPAEWGKVSQF
ncbi:orotate phosphoribosyltransferase [Cytobacillus firmus]|uniref:orotate phosphoribosyltransferase n=1 Tax=Cytobacillus firmus TaxID=1399 RepID=UPI001580E019|nr:orotate phosphoribosyltransferase [Cytobacillus firmus]MBG9656760.1 orotate phosphoribosyltransferase [Cytobacillus firmus]MDD9312865.1 orotate phosphoribosyltransferase [Cytobacillus firmus]MED1906583.1 orotate phosphoribosyltransferase [Cytobacillus firmus]NUH82602.1 orotate phosphoribosyltransferase [Cytobacillus firmus]